MIFSDNKPSGLSDVDGVEIKGGDSVVFVYDREGTTSYWIDYLPKYELWAILKQYGSMDELSLIGNLEHCINNLGLKFKIKGHIKP